MSLGIPILVKICCIEIPLCQVFLKTKDCVMKKKSISGKKEAGVNEEFPLPIYADKEDIYNQEKKVKFEEEEGKLEDRQEELDNDPAHDLDVPGSELDDADEAIGEEDEENNYYSLGGDRHEDLEEDRD